MPKSLERGMLLKNEGEGTIEKVPAGTWIEMKPGMEIEYRGTKANWENPTEERDRMSYNTNNGVVVCVDGKGQVRFSTDTSEHIQALEMAGYKKSNLLVPFSNGEVPVDPALREQWGKMREVARELAVRETTKAHIECFREEAKKKQLKEVAGDWLIADGIEATFHGEKLGTMSNTDGYNMDADRLEKVGVYGCNNGVVGFVDDEGRMRIAPETDESVKALEDAGYKRGHVLVPFSSGEKISDPTVRSRWEKMQEIAMKERDRFAL